MLVSCGGSGDCVTEKCSSGLHSYRVCVGATTTTTYEYSGSSCACDNASTTGCEGCATEVAAYCGDGDGGTSMTDDLGSTDTQDLSTPQSCSIVGSFSASTSTTASTLLSASSGGSFTLDIQSSSALIDIEGIFSVAGNAVSLTNTSSLPDSIEGCIGDTATYALAWDTSCTTVTFTRVSDTCTGRVADVNGSTLTRQ